MQYHKCSNTLLAIKANEHEQSLLIIFSDESASEWSSKLTIIYCFHFLKVYESQMNMKGIWEV